MTNDLDMILMQVENLAQESEIKGYKNLAHALRRAAEPFDCETEVA